jgi:hypothetical protein
MYRVGPSYRLIPTETSWRGRWKQLYSGQSVRCCRCVLTEQSRQKNPRRAQQTLLPAPIQMGESIESLRGTYLAWVAQLSGQISPF